VITFIAYKYSESLSNCKGNNGYNLIIAVTENLRYFYLFIPVVWPM